MVMRWDDYYDGNVYVILYILMCNKSRILSDFPIRKVYVYSIYISYVYAEVYVNLQVEVEF